MADGGYNGSFGGFQEVLLGPEAAGARLDRVLATYLPGYSRSFLAKLLKAGAILVDGQEAKPHRKVRGGERVEIEIPEPEPMDVEPEAIPLKVVYEDEEIVGVDKAPGMPSHPGPGHARGTLVNALLSHCASLSSLNGAFRPGIVHRLDRETSGVMVVAKSDRAHRALQEQFMARTVTKRYLALCLGHPPRQTFVCEGRIGRHPKRRTEMTVMRGPEEGRAARTDFRVLAHFQDPRGGAPLSFLLAQPHTGRTHQIRVHLAKTGFPVLADTLYGPPAAGPLLGLTRHALHAWSLAFLHPATGKPLRLLAPLPDDMRNALRALHSFRRKR